MEKSNINSLNMCNELYKYYFTLLESYVCDFYTDNHWNKLTENWKLFFSHPSNMVDIGALLDFDKPLAKKVYPLSVACLRSLIIQHTIPRTQQRLRPEAVSGDGEEIFMKHFWKNVKRKKRHEISIMAKRCYDTAMQTNCLHIVDIGSGLGHLSRMLSFGYGFKMCTFEANKQLVTSSNELDYNFYKILQTKTIRHNSIQKNIHVNEKIQFDINANFFLKSVLHSFGESENSHLRFGIVGLHPCGDLGSTLLRLYNECNNIAFINIVSCCYMKISLPPSIHLGFPLSNFCKRQNFTLSYLSCEIACHAIESYAHKLQSNDYSQFKIHAYRAALEELLVQQTNLRHSPTANVKYDSNMNFRNYCDRALKKMPVGCLPNDDEIVRYDDLIETTWHRVVAFYSLRLLLAPIVETIILMDRFLYAEEGGNSKCSILPMFDSKISPRNHILSAVKHNKLPI